MKLLLVRFWPRSTRTLGALYVNGRFFCYTLEDRLRPKGEKVPGETAIPAGTYTVVLVNSPKFGPDTPSLVNVPDFTFILIHAGMTETDTRGCILVADTLSHVTWTLQNSRQARDRLKGVLKEAIARGEKVEITIQDDVTAWTRQEIEKSAADAPNTTRTKS